MDTNPRFTEAAIQGYIAEHRGERFTAPDLAETFGAGTKAMTETLNNMFRQQKVRKTASDGKRSYFYLPTEDELSREAHANRARPFKPLSAGSLPDLNYDRRRSGSGDMLRVASKHV